MGKILLTGASGFIGRRLAPLLVRAYGAENVFCYAYLKDSPHERAGQEVLEWDQITYKKIDLLDPTTLTALPKDASVIIHLAGTTDTDARDFSSNDIGTENLLAALEPGTATHILFAGSSSLYAGRSDLAHPITPTTPASPTNAYGRSKWHAEEILARSEMKQGFKLTIMRFNTVYGPVPRKNSLFDVLKEHIEKQALVARLNWPGRTSIIHVDDVCRRILRLLEEPEGKKDFYLFSAESLTLATMYEVLHRVLHKPYKRTQLPMWFWKILSFKLRLVRYFEWCLPMPLYNALWRANLIAGNVLWYEPNDADLKGDQKDKTFVETIEGILASGIE